MTFKITSLRVAGMASVLAAIASAAALADETAPPPSSILHLHNQEKRQLFDDSYQVFVRKRNAHACLMSIVFIVLYPVGAISLHLPLHGVVKRVVTRLHAPIQILGLCIMVAAMGLGIDIARNDLHYIDPVQTHVAIGLLVTSTILAVQPAMGVIQHLHFRRTGKKSVFAYAHRWVGRVAIVLGWANSWLGFELVGWELVANHSRVRNGTFMAVLGGVWLSLVGVDGLRHHWLKREKLAAFGLRWSRFKGPVLAKDSGGEEELKEMERQASRT